MLEEIEKVLRDEEIIKAFIKKFGKKDVIIKDGCLSFNEKIGSRHNGKNVYGAISYNNAIVNLFYNHPDFGKGFGKYKFPVVCICWKGEMQIHSIAGSLVSLRGYSTAEIIGMIFGYIELEKGEIPTKLEGYYNNFNVYYPKNHDE